MKSLKNILLIAFAVLTSAFAQEDVTKSFPAEKNDKLFIKIGSGDVTINFWNKTEVKLTLTNVEKENLEYLSMGKSDGKIVLTYEPYHAYESSDVVAFIPADLNLEVGSAGGSIIVKGNLNGKCTVSTSGGDVALQDVSGDVSVETSGGDITVGNMKGKVKLATAGGDIVAGDIAKQSKINTAGGDIETGFLSGEANLSTAGGDIVFKGSSASVKVSTAGGDIRVDDVLSDAKLTTAGGSISIKNGKGKLVARTSGGNIRVDKLVGEIEASTSGGNIVLKDVTGSVDAKTSGGNVTLVLNPSEGTNSTVSNAEGNITLNLPADSKATIDVRIGLNLAIDESEISRYLKSDFKAEEVTLHKAKRIITAKYNINGGGSLIELKTSDGEVSIRKK